MSRKNKQLTDEEIEKLSFGTTKILYEIPKFTDVLIITSISRATNGNTNIITKTYDTEEIENMTIKGE